MSKPIPENKFWKSTLMVCGLALAVAAPSCKNKPMGEDEIMKECEKITKALPQYKLKQMEGYPEPEKRSLSGYFEDDKLRLINESYFSDTDRVFTHYYVKSNALIYAYREDFIYNRPVNYTEDSAKKNNDSVWYDDTTTVLKTSDDYFADGKMLKWLDTDKKPVPPTAKAFDTKRDELLGNFMLYDKMLKTKDDL